MKLKTEQYHEIARTVAGTTANVYTLAKSRYRHDWTQSDFDKLAEVGEVFRCAECNTWSDTAERSDAESTICAECMARIDGREDE